MDCGCDKFICWWWTSEICKFKRCSIWIPSSESECTFWKPSSEFSSCKSSSESKCSFWRWKPSSESEGGFSKPSEPEGSFWKPWKPSSESDGRICKPSSSDSEEPNPSLKTWCHWNSDEPIEYVQRRFRRDVAKEFRKEYKFEHGRIWSNGIYSSPDCSTRVIGTSNGTLYIGKKKTKETEGYTSRDFVGLGPVATDARQMQVLRPS